MKNGRNNTIVKCLIWGIVWTAILCLIACIIKANSSYYFKDILFIEGIIVIAIGMLSSIGGNPMGLSINSMGKSNAQYAANANLEISKMEKEKVHDSVKSSIKIGLSTMSLGLAGVICIVINFII